MDRQATIIDPGNGGTAKAGGSSPNNAIAGTIIDELAGSWGGSSPNNAIAGTIIDELAGSWAGSSEIQIEPINEERT